MCGLHSEEKQHDDLALLQRPSRAEVERDTAVVQRIPPLYLYLSLRDKMSTTLHCSGCSCLGLMDSFLQ